MKRDDKICTTSDSAETRHDGMRHDMSNFGFCKDYIFFEEVCFEELFFIIDPTAFSGATHFGLPEHEDALFVHGQSVG